MRSHVFAIVRSCFAALRQVRSVRRSLMRQTPLSLVHALGVSKFDYCNSIQRLCTPFGQIAVRAECRCPANLLVTEVRTQPVTPWTLLIASSGENPIPTVFWHFAAFTARHHRTLLAVYAMLPMSTVVVTSARPTQCRWSFHQFGARHLAAARAWNDLLPMIRASPSTNNLKHSFFIQHFTDLTTGLSELNCAKCLCSVLRCLLGMLKPFIFRNR